MRCMTQSMVLGLAAAVLLQLLQGNMQQSYSPFAHRCCRDNHSEALMHRHRQMQTSKVCLTNGVTCLDIRLAQPVQLFHWLDPCMEQQNVVASKLLASAVISLFRSGKLYL